MSQFLKICAASALLAASSFAVQAADAPQPATPAAPTAIAADAQVVVRDADTGELRAPTASEYQTLQAQGSKLRQLARPLLMKSHASGAVGVRLNEEYMSYSVVVKQADGRLVEYCFSSPEAAQAAIGAPASTVNTLPTE
jgi:hypothetical protein